MALGKIDTLISRYVMILDILTAGADSAIYLEISIDITNTRNKAFVVCSARLPNRPCNGASH
jgi:hypothetical protein